MGTLSSLYSELALSSPRDIRLVILHPALEQEAPSVCDLDGTSLDDAPEFEALSYVWGDTPRHFSAVCTGFKTTLTDNLADALRRLRDKTRHRILWIDALCINQEDVQERNQQVRLMRDIYQKAAEIIVWLGEPSNDLITPITLINECFAERDPPDWGKDCEGYDNHSKTLKPVSDILSMQVLSKNAMRYCSRGFDNMVRKLVDVLYGHEGDAKFQMNDSTWTALKDFYDRPCWDSLTLATFLLSDPSFSQAWLEKKSLSFHELLTRTVYQDTLEGGKLVPVEGDTVIQDALSLEKLLHIARQRQATDPKVNAGYLHRNHENHNRTDEKSPSSTSGGLATNQSHSPVLGSRLELTKLRLRLYSPPLRRFLCLLNHPYIPNPSDPHPFHLTIRGFVYDRIAKRKTNMFQRFADECCGQEPPIELISNLLHPLSPDEIYSPDGESSLQSIGRTFTADLMAGEGRSQHSTEHNERRPNLCSWILTRKPPNPLATDSNPHQQPNSTDHQLTHTVQFEESRRIYIRDLASSMAQILSNLKAYNFFVSGKEHIGLCPCGAALGDLICIVLGSEVPLVLRSSGSEYLLVGGAYVHGIMDGEAMAKAKRIGYKEFILA